MPTTPPLVPTADPELRLGRQVAFWAPKGGVGATTVAVNVAAAACEFDLRVAYADLDHRGGDGALFFGAATGDLDAPGGAWRHACGLRGHVAADAAEAEALASGLRAGHDLVVVDLPSGMSPGGIEADLLVVVVGCSLAALVRARRGLAGGEAAAPPECVVVAAGPGAGIRPRDVDAVLGLAARAVLPHDGGLPRRGDRGVFSYGLHRNAWAQVVRDLTEDICAGLVPAAAGGVEL